MNEQDLAPLDAETLEILRAEKDPPRAPPEVAARVLGRIEAAILQGPSSQGPDDALPPGAPQSLAAIRHGAAGLARAAQLTAAFAAGGVAGAAAHAWIATPATAPAHVVEKPAPSGERPPVPPEQPAVPPLIIDVDTPSPAAVAPPAASASDLSAERALLDQAQRAFARGDTPASLGFLNAHGRRFPRGRLEEEREALTVKALAAAGRYDEAKSRGARFRNRFPDSILLPTVDDALRAIP